MGRFPAGPIFVLLRMDGIMAKRHGEAMLRTDLRTDLAWIRMDLRMDAMQYLDGCAPTRTFA